MRCRCLASRYSFIVPQGRSIVVVRDPAKADHVVPFFAIERIHARFTNDSGELFVQAVEPQNETYINGNRIVGPDRVRLRPGDRVKLLPDVQFVVEKVT
jgi:pSer/pThr/pTyr-binding forkhead associated (FHA) protein